MSDDLYGSEYPEPQSEGPKRSPLVLVGVIGGVVLCLCVVAAAIGWTVYSASGDVMSDIVTELETGGSGESGGIGAQQASTDLYDGLFQERLDDGAPGFAIGDPDAPVTLVEYGDFSCPHCKNLSHIMDDVIANYVTAGEVRIVFKPITFVNPPTSVPAAQAAICAGEQGQFWQMAHSMFALSHPSEYTTDNLDDLAAGLNLDMDSYSTCYNAQSTLDDIDAVMTEAGGLGIRGVPTVFINGEELPYTGADTFPSVLNDAIEAILGQSTN